MTKIGEGIVHQVIGDSDKVPFIGMLHAKTLESAQVIPVAHLLKELLLNRPGSTRKGGTAAKGDSELMLFHA